MAGGLLNIISVGNNNIFLTGNPTKTFFKAVYSKYTNFGLQKFRIDFEGLRDLRLTEESKYTFKIPRYAELLLDSFLVISLPDIWSPIYHPSPETNDKWVPYEFKWIRDLGTHMIKEISIVCGSNLIQKYSGEYLAAMVERDFDASKKDLFNKMTGNVTELNDPANAHGRLNSYPSSYYNTNLLNAEPSIRGRKLYIPINTWFSLSSKCAFPLASMQYNELYINVTIRPIQDLFQIRDVYDEANGYPYIRPDFNQAYQQLYRFLQVPPSIDVSPESYENTTLMWKADVHMLCTYCFLSNDEAQLFASDSQIYLLKDIVEYTFRNVAGSSKIDVKSSGMVSNWMWFFRRNDVNMRNEWSNYTNWPYRQLPSNIVNAPTLPPLGNTEGFTVGPYYHPDGSHTGIHITGTFTDDNRYEIMQTMGIVLNGDYRENLLDSGVFQYVEKYTRTNGFANNGLYCYNFCLNTNPYEYQPSGAINLSKFKTIELELTTHLPKIDPANSVYDLVCDGTGNIIGVNKQNWRLYEYNYDMVLFEERYNILSFMGGNCGMLYAK